MSGLKVNGLTVAKSQDLPCGNCGTCCTVYGLVDLHVSDVFRISEHLGLTPEEFFREYCSIIPDKDGSLLFSLDINGGCRFRVDGRCSIYSVRPDTCALYPFNYLCLNLSATTKKEIACYQQCFVHKLDENLLVVPNIERMIYSRILFMEKELYMASFDGTFREGEAKPFHLRGQSLVSNPKMREIVYLKMLSEMRQKMPVDSKTQQPVLSEQDLKAICDYARKPGPA